MVLYKPVWQCGISIFQSNLLFNAQFTSKYVVRNCINTYLQVLLPKPALFLINKLHKSTEIPKKPWKPPNSTKSIIPS